MHFYYIPVRLTVLLFVLIYSVAVSGEELSDMRENNIESLGAGADGPGGDVFYSVRAQGDGAHDFIHDLTEEQRDDGAQVLWAYFKDTGSRWVYLGTRNSNGEISRTYFDLVEGVVGERASIHRAELLPRDDGWYLARIRYSGSNVTSVYFGIAEADGSPFFVGDPSTDRIFLSGASHDSVPSTSAMQRAIWIWEADYVLDRSRREELLAFVHDRGINTLYLNGIHPILYYQDALAEAIRTFRSEGVDIELTYGRPEWALYENHHKVMDFVDMSIEFTKRYPDAVPTGIHLDIEPHSISEWRDNHNSVANQLVDLFYKVRDRIAGTSLTLSVDMPVWFENYTISRGGNSRGLHKIIIDVVDGVTLMDYRDTRERLVKDAAEELRYASKAGKRVVVGVETKCVPTDLITFCEEGRRYMDRTMDAVEADLQGYSAYGGSAVHLYESYRQLGR